VKIDEGTGASRLDSFTSGERSPVRIDREVGWTTKTGWTFGKDKKLAHAHEPNLGSSASHPLAKSLY